MTIRQMMEEEVQARETFGAGWGPHSRAYTDDAGGVVLFTRPRELGTTSGKLPRIELGVRLRFGVVLNGGLKSINHHADALRFDMRELGSQLAAQYQGLRDVTVGSACVNFQSELWVRYVQVVKGRLRDAVLDLPEALVEDLRARSSEIVLRAVRLEVLQARQKHVEREARQILNQISSNLWGEAARAVNYQARHDALREERRGAYVAARLDLALRAREELAAEIDDPEVLEAVIAGVADVGQPATLILND